MGKTKASYHWSRMALLESKVYIRGKPKQDGEGMLERSS